MQLTISSRMQLRLQVGRDTRKISLPQRHEDSKYILFVTLCLRDCFIELPFEEKCDARGDDSSNAA